MNTENDEVIKMLIIHEKEIGELVDKIEEVLKEESYIHLNKRVVKLNKALFRIKYLRAVTLRKLRSYFK